MVASAEHFRFRGLNERAPEKPATYPVEYEKRAGELIARERYAHAPRCLNKGAPNIMEADNEKAQYAWDHRWSRVIECDALLASMVAKKCGALP